MKTFQNNASTPVPPTLPFSPTIPMACCLCDGVYCVQAEKIYITLKPCRCAPLVELHRGLWDWSFWGVPCWDYLTFAFPARLWEVWGRFLLDSGEGKDLCGLWLDLKSWGSEVWPNNLGLREGLYLNKLSWFEHSTTINYLNLYKSREVHSVLYTVPRKLKWAYMRWIFFLKRHHLLWAQ